MGEFGQLLRAARLTAGLTQEELAQRSTLSARAVSNLERGVTARPYPRTVTLLAEALGLDEAGRATLARTARPVDGGGVPQPAVLPHQLPGAITDFTGRSAELGALTGLLEREGHGPGTVVISAIGGTAGVGKTALAVHWAHHVAHRFPDGQLYVNLHGYDPGEPTRAADALAAFLRALGVPGPDIPAEEDERAARYRSVLAGRQVLILLDNADSAEQVRPLLPGSPNCAVIVTSRDSLAGLTVRDGARRLELDLLPPADAEALLTALIGERAAVEPGATAALAAQCCRLPLALRVAAELAAARSHTPLTSLTAELADRQRRLDLLATDGDPHTAVRAVFSWSYWHLAPTAARMFRLAGLHPGPDTDDYAAAALTGTGLDGARDQLDLLVRAHLLQPAGPGRYAMHDLLRAYARELAASQDGDGSCRAALTRLHDYYLGTAAGAMDVLFPAEQHRRPRIRPPAAATPPLPDTAAALAWLDAHQDHLAALVMHAAEGWPGHVTRLAATLFRYLEAGGHFAMAITIHTSALNAARRTGDRAAEAGALTNLGVADLQQSRFRQATGHLGQALALYRAAGDRSGEARALGNLGIVDSLDNRLPQAAEHHGQALAICREAGDRNGEARALVNLGIVATRMGRYGQAAGHHRQALAICRETGDPNGEAHALTRLGIVEALEGRYRHAASSQQQAVDLFRRTGNRYGEAHSLTRLGRCEQLQGSHQRAAAHHEQALVLFRISGDRPGESEARNNLGEMLLATGKLKPALSEYTTALQLASETEEKIEQARAHDGLGRVHEATGNEARARRHWQQALALYTELDAPEAGEIRAVLTGISFPP